MNAMHITSLEIIITFASTLSLIKACGLYCKSCNTTVPPRAVLFTLCLSCCFFISACAAIPARVPESLRHTPRARNARVDASETNGPTNMIVSGFSNPGTDTLPSGPAFGEYSIETCGGPSGKLLHEWQDVKPASQMWLVHGNAAASEFSGADFWGNHRYRDWNILLVVDREHEKFLAPANFLDSGWDDSPIAQDLRTENPDLESLMEVEWDSGFFPPEMAPEAGDETLVIGRWAFDCGHEGAAKSSPSSSTGFRTEIHAPAILVSSHIVESSRTSIQTRFKIYAGSRGGPLDTITLLFFLQRLWGSHQNPLGGKDYSLNLQAPQDGWRIAACTALPGTAVRKKPEITKTVDLVEGAKSVKMTLSAHEFRPSARIEGSTVLNVRWVPADSLPTGGGVTKCEEVQQNANRN